MAVLLHVMGFNKPQRKSISLYLIVLISVGILLNDFQPDCVSWSPVRFYSFKLYLPRPLLLQCPKRRAEGSAAAPWDCSALQGVAVCRGQYLPCAGYRGG